MKNVHGSIVYTGPPLDELVGCFALLIQEFGHDCATQLSGMSVLEQVLNRSENALEMVGRRRYMAAAHEFVRGAEVLKEYLTNARSMTEEQERVLQRVIDAKTAFAEGVDLSAVEKEIVVNLWQASKIVRKHRSYEAGYNAGQLAMVRAIDDGMF